MRPLAKPRRPFALPPGFALAALGAVAVAHADGSRSASSVELERLRGSAERDERALKQRLEAIAKEAAHAEGRILARGRSYVRLARAGLMPVGEGFDALVEHAARLERLHHGLEADLARSKALAAERLAVAEKLAEVRARVGTIEEQQRVVARAEDALRSQEERERAFADAFEGGGHTAVYGAAGPADPALAADGMAALRGKLPFPLAGRSEIRSARRASSDGPGLEMRAPRGTPVRSVFAGRVAFADTYADYGKTVIIDHGRRHYTVSANLEAIDVAVGDELAAGARLGSVGDSGNGARLYFEIRVGKDTVRPEDWFGI
jgi:septal ring factor EnvC (AmiA/AmiB activator)